jgi:hypothetical protein
MARRRDPLEGVNLLEIAPERVAGWREEADRVVVERPLPPVRGVRSLFRRLSFLTGVKRLRLDELGSAVWRRLDGRSVGEVVDGLREEFGERCEPAEGRLQLYVGILRRERLIAFPGFDDDLIAEHRESAAARPV